MMTTMTVVIMTMFAMPMMAQDEVWINGEEKTVYYVEVYPNVGFQNGFTIFLYLSPDKKEYINVMGDNTLHAGGFFYPVDITRYEIDFTDRCHWYVSYYKDNKVKVETCGNWRFDLDIFSEGRLTVSGGDPNSGRFGVDLWGIITQNTCVNPAKRNVLDLKNETYKIREKRNVLKVSRTRHSKATKKQSKSGCFYCV